MTRWISIAAGLVLIAVAFLAGSNVADTREGLVAEVVTLLSGLAGAGLLLYGLVPKRRTTGSLPPAPPASKPATRSANDLLVGSSGLVLAALLLTGLGVSGGWRWALLGGALLVPMTAWSAYLVAAFIRAPERDWRIDLQRLTGHR